MWHDLHVFPQRQLRYDIVVWQVLQAPATLHRAKLTEFAGIIHKRSTHTMASLNSTIFLTSRRHTRGRLYDSRGCKSTMQISWNGKFPPAHPRHTCMQLNRPWIPATVSIPTINQTYFFSSSRWFPYASSSSFNRVYH